MDISSNAAVPALGVCVAAVLVLVQAPFWLVLVIAGATGSIWALIGIVINKVQLRKVQKLQELRRLQDHDQLD